MKIEILNSGRDGEDTIITARIPKEVDCPPLPEKDHKEEWKEFWKHKKDAKLIHLGEAELEQKELGEDE